MDKKKTAKKRKKKKSSVGLWILLVVLLAGTFCAWQYGYLPWRDKQKYPLKYTEHILAVSEKYQLDPYLLCGMIWVESRFNPEAVSKVGATGLLQVMPETGQWLAGKLDLEDYDENFLTQPQYSIEMGGWYLRFLLDRYDGDEHLALTAYNAGQNQVDKWLEDPAVSPDGKTLQNVPGTDAPQYAGRVQRARAQYERIYEDAFAA